MGTYDVAVIGAGLSGLWCARALGRRGLRVLLIDARSAIDTSVRTTGIFVRRTLEDFDLPAGSLGPPIRNVVLYSPKRRTIVLESRHEEFRIADMRAVYRALLADCVRAGVDWMPASRYADLGFDRAVLALRVERRCGTSAGRMHWTATSISARFIVAADGARSRVAADLGLSANHEFLIGLEDVYDDTPSRSSAALHCFLDPRLAPGYIAWVARDGHEAHVGLAGDAGRFRPAHALRTLSRSLEGVIELSPAHRRERRGGLIPCNGVLRHIACSRGLLLGDAAGAVSPLTAGGLDGCVRLAELAARLIPEHLHAPDGRALEGYDGRRFAARFIARRWMRRILSNSGERTLELACAALATPFTRSLAEHIFFGRGSFPDTGTARALRETGIAHRPAR